MGLYGTLYLPGGPAGQWLKISLTTVTQELLLGLASPKYLHNFMLSFTPYNEIKPQEGR